MTMTQDSPTAERLADASPAIDRVDEDDLLPQLVAHLREHRSRLREEWANRIHGAHLLEAMTPQETTDETTSVYDNYVEVLETGSVEALQHYARDLSERIIPRGVETHEVVGIVLLLRDVLARSLFEKYQRDFDFLNRVLDAYEPAANRIANTVAVSFVGGTGTDHSTAAGLPSVSCPRRSCPVREQLLILPIIGILDTERARQLTEQLLTGIRTHRARVVVIDVTGGAGGRRGSSQPPRADRGCVTSDGRQRHHYRAVTKDCPDAGDDRRRPQQDAHDR
jgi:rsbT co-antagonist protein RsbR